MDALAAKSPVWLIFIAAALIIVFATFVFVFASNWKYGFITLISGAFGFCLKASGFGFTCSFRAMFQTYDFSKFRGMILMILSASCFIALISVIPDTYPLFYGKMSQFSTSGSPISVSLAIGSYLFGAGMILGSGCASGSLVGIGEGFVKSYVTLPFFIFGATLASTDAVYGWWNALPASKPIILPFYAIAIILAALFGLTYLEYHFRPLPTIDAEGEGLEDIRKIISIETPQPENPRKAPLKVRLLAYGYDILIGLIVAVFFLCVGSTIGVMGAFAKIGARICQLFGANPGNWKFFKERGGLPKSLLDDAIFNSDISVIFGAFLASSIKRNFGKSQKNGILEMIKAVFGGIMMGVGARMAYGCNIGSMLSGITCRSLHGFIWMFCAIAGSATVVYIDKYFEGRKKSINTYMPID